MPGMLSHIPIESIRAKPRIRMVTEDAALAHLAESIRQHGVLLPLLGHTEDGKVVLDDGHRRLSVARRTGPERNVQTPTA